MQDLKHSKAKIMTVQWSSVSVEPPIIATPCAAPITTTLGFPLKVWVLLTFVHAQFKTTTLCNLWTSIFGLSLCTGATQSPLVEELMSTGDQSCRYSAICNCSAALLVHTHKLEFLLSFSMKLAQGASIYTLSYLFEIEELIITSTCVCISVITVLVATSIFSETILKMKEQDTVHQL